MSDCTHDCSSCGENCAERQGESPFQIKPLREGCRVGKVYGVVTSVDHPGAQDIYTVKAPSGKEYMFPVSYTHLTLPTKLEV